MRWRARVGSTVWLALACTVLCGCSGGGSPSASGGNGSALTGPARSQFGALPRLIGQNTVDALESIHGAGFLVPGFMDASGQGRQWNDQPGQPAWTVCFQIPAPGNRDRYVPVQMGAVPASEPCPARNRGWASNAGGSGLTEDLRGQRVVDAIDAIDVQAKVTVLDAGTGKKPASEPGGWTVCATSVQPGSPLTEQTAELRAVPPGTPCEAAQTG